MSEVKNICCGMLISHPIIVVDAITNKCDSWQVSMALMINLFTFWSQLTDLLTQSPLVKFL